jgi:uncharacterized repeat protein (TIGR01451 family)
MKRFVQKPLLIIGLLSILSFGYGWTQTPSGTEITNTARATYDGGGGVVVEVPSDTVVTRVREGLLSIEKTTDAQVVALGDTIMYQIRVRNRDESSLTNVTIRDSLDQMLSYIRSNPSGRLIAGNVVEWQIPDIRVDELVVFQLYCKIIEAVYQDSVINTAYYETSDGYRGHSEALATVWQPWPAVKIDKTVDRESAFIGDTLTYGLRIENTGPMTLTQLVVNDTLPHGTRFITSSEPADTSNGVFQWIVETLEPGGESEIELQVEITAEAGTDSILNFAYLGCAEGVRDTADTASACLGYGGHLFIKKFADDSLYAAGDTVLYKIAVGNSGTRPVHDAVVRDTLANGLSYLSATHNAAANADTVVWRLGTMQPGFLDTLELETVIQMPIDDQTVIENIAAITCSEGLQDTSLWTIKVSSQPVLLLNKTSRDTASPGDTLVYTLICMNHGTAVAREAVLRDTLPEYLEYVNASESHVYDSESRSVIWTGRSLSPGECDTLILTTRVGESVENGTEIENTAWLLDKHTASVAVSSCSTSTEPVDLTGSLYAYKKVDRKRADVGDTLTYTIWYGTKKHNVKDTVYIVDYLPRELRLLPDEGMQKPVLEMESYDPVTNQLRMRRLGLKTSDRDSILLRALALETIGPGIREIENRAEVHCGQDTIRTVDDKRSEAKTRLLKPFLSVKKTVNRKVSEVGDILTYTVILENKSEESWLTPIEVVDRMPEGFRYETGTSRLESKPFTEPEIKGSVMTWMVRDTLQPGRTFQLKYRLIVGLSAGLGEYENRVIAAGQCEFGDWIYSDEAKASVLIRRGAFDDRGFIFGKVYADENENGMHDDSETAFGKIELIMEDGTRVITDEFGKYSIPDVEPGQHVLRLNERTLPKDVDLFCNSLDFLFDPKSRLIRLSPAGVAKANFAVRRIEKTE